MWISFNPAVFLCCFIFCNPPFSLSLRLDTRKPKCFYTTALKTHWSINRLAHWVDLCTFCSAIRTRTDGNSKLPLSALLLLKRKKKGLLEKLILWNCNMALMMFTKHLSLEYCLYGSIHVGPKIHFGFYKCCDLILSHAEWVCSLKKKKKCQQPTQITNWTASLNWIQNITLVRIMFWLQ